MTDTTQAERNAVEVGHHLGAPGWYAAFLTVCSVEAKPRDYSQRNPKKLGLVKFSKLSNQSDKIVNSILKAWDNACNDGLVPSAKTLNPEDEMEFDPKTFTYVLWMEYFDAAAAKKRSSDALNKRRENAKKKRHKKTVVESVETDPSIEKAVRKALAEKDRKEWEEKRAKAAEELAEAELQAIAAGGRVPTAEELEPKPTKLSVMADALEAEAECLGDIEKLPKMAKDLEEVLRRVVNYGTIPDNGGLALSQMQEFLRILNACIWEATPMVPQESEAR